MSEAGASQAELDRMALEDFVVSNEDLERLEALLDRFNIFEAIGVVRQELRHSDFLAFLLDPRENHGLGDTFVKRLLQRVLMTASGTSVPVTPIELKLWDLSRMEIQREWQHIDILLLDGQHELAVIVENKIGSGEHSNQLWRYWEVVERHHPGWRVVGLYLTPGGEDPSEEAYLPVDYGLVCDVIDGLAEGRASVVNQDVKILMAHYTEMLRRHIVGDSEIARVCRQIYQKHRRALDLIYEHRPDLQAEIKDVLEELVASEPALERDSGGKSIIRFVVSDWDTPALLTSSGWTRSGRILMFEFWNNPDNLTLALVIGPGSEETRQRMFDMARANPEAFEDPWKAAGAWYGIYTCEFLSGGMYEDADQEDREREIRRRWDEFLEVDLPSIDAVLRNEEWIWGSAESDNPR